MSSYRDYYLAELSFLREMGREFAAAYPEVGHMLADPGGDPDVERLLEGFAFLTGQVRQKLDDEFPEIIHALAQLIFPEYLRPIPAAAMLRFDPLPNLLHTRQRIPRGTEVASIPIEGTSCRFRTTQDVELLPLSLEQVALETPRAVGAELRLSFRLQGGLKVNALAFDRLRLHLIGTQAGQAHLLYLWLCRRTSDVLVRRREGGPEIRLGRSAVVPAALGEDEALLPRVPHTFGQFRLLQELHTLPTKFLAVDVAGLGRASALGAESAFDLVFQFSEPITGSPRIGRDDFALFATPIVNIFAHDADPITLDHDRTEYRLRPNSTNTGHYTVYSVEEVTSRIQGRSERRTYEPLLSFRRAGQGGFFYLQRLRPAVVGDASETYLSFSLPPSSGGMLPSEVVSAALLCTNGKLPTQLRIGDISVPTASSPPVATFRNLTVPTAPVEPPLGDDLLWRLLAHLRLSYRALSEVETLRDALALYNFQARVDRQAARAGQLRLAGIRRWQLSGADRLLRGAAIRGLRFDAEIDESAFINEGELFLFAVILDQVLGSLADLNSFSELHVTAAASRNVYAFAPRTGAA